MILDKNYIANITNICEKRNEIARLLIAESKNIKDTNIKALSSADIRTMYELYDQIFFNNWFRDKYKGKLKFSLSKRMTKSAGLTVCPRNIDNLKPEDLFFEIKIGVEFFFHYDVVNEIKKVCGIVTKSSLEALQLVFEHELCHVIEFIQYKKSSCKNKRFKDMANKIFGHLDSYHRLHTHKQIAKDKLGLNIGDVVAFSLEGRKLKGVISNINKRATVMVLDKKGIFKDNRGNRYTKYYVPLGHFC